MYVERNRFLSLVQNYTSLSEAEAIELDGLQRDFPFSQVIHNLATRAAQDNQLPTHKHLLNISAVYATDRLVLKELMTTPRQERVVAITEREPVIEHTPSIIEEQQVVVKQELPPVNVRSTLSGDRLINEIASDLSRLKELRHNFELSLREFEQAHSNPIPLAAQKKIVKKAKASEEDSHLDVLIEEIKTNKKEVDPEGERQKEQFQIIDQFIKKSPAISRAKATPSSSSDQEDDLAEKSSAFGDHIISETLVDILLKQGKNDKAIEVLRKLIWKFPQKKAIFAAQIENLRK